MQTGQIIFKAKRKKTPYSYRKIGMTSLKPQSPQATVCCKVGAAALVHLRPGGPGLPNRGFKSRV